MIRKWKILEQKGELCKHIKFFPSVSKKKNPTTGLIERKESFGTLGFICLRIVISDDVSFFNLGYSAYRSLDDPSYSVSRYDKKVMKNVKESYDHKKEFEKRIKPFLGEKLTAEILYLFNTTAQSIALLPKSEKKEKVQK